MMRPALTAKAPGEIEKYGVDWTKVLKASVTIVTSTWSVPAGITKVTDGIDGLSTPILLSGGTAGVDYTLVNTIVTSDGQTLDEAMQVRVRTAAQIAGI